MLKLTGKRAQPGLHAIGQNDEGIVVKKMGNGFLVVGEVFLIGRLHITMNIFQFHKQQRNAVDESNNVRSPAIQITLHLQFPDAEEMVVLRLIEIKDIQALFPGLSIRVAVKNLHAVPKEIIFLLIGGEGALAGAGFPELPDGVIIRLFGEIGIECLQLPAEIAYKDSFPVRPSAQRSIGAKSLLAPGMDGFPAQIILQVFRRQLKAFNPDLPEEAYDDAVRQLRETGAGQSALAANQEKYDLLRNGVKVFYRDADGESREQRLNVFDFDQAENNHFLCVRELQVKGDLYRRRADIVGFVNGIPLLFMELKNVHRDVQAAYEENLSDYKETIPHLFHHNAFIILANGVEARLGSLSSKFEHFQDWKRLDEEDEGEVEMETPLKRSSMFVDNRRAKEKL